MPYESYSKCTCGALTVYTDQGAYSCYWRNRKKHFPKLDLRKLVRLPETFACDHCCNHYGLDLCGCGSGNLFGHCDLGLDECDKPMQKLNAYTRIVAENAWV